MASRFSRRLSGWVLVLLWLMGGLPALWQNAVRAAPPRQATMTVIINEVAWGGTAASASDEWIELYNGNDTDVDLNGWRLVASDGSPDITLTGILAAHSFYLLERSDDNTISDLAANQIFTGELQNTNQWLELRDSNGHVVDTAGAGLASWPAGTGSPNYYSMERKGMLPDTPAAWASNDGVTRNGLDANNNPLNGTPRQPNSAVPPTPTTTFTETPTFTETLTPTFTHTFTPSLTFTATPIAPTHLVISELRFRGPLGAGDEFVELYNPTGAAVNIGGWQVRKSSGCSTSTSSLATIPAGVILEPGQHYLLAHAASGLAGIADQNYSSGIADDGGVALFTAAGVMVDQVGLCASTAYREGQTLAALTQNADQGYERLPGGATGCYDTDDNAADFQFLSPSQPQNRAAPAVMCAGVSLSTATSTATPTFTRTPTRTITPVPGVVVINEFLPHASTDWNADGRADVGDEYIEIMNVGTQSVNLRNWKLDDDLGGSSPFSLPDVTIQPRQIMRFFGSQTGILLNDSGDSVRLLRPGGQTADIFNYPVATIFDRAWCRLPDGSGLWTFSCRPTPGRPNVPAADLGTPSASPAVSPCPLSDLALPPSILLVECSGPAVWNPAFQMEGGLWLQGGDKWGTFLH